MPGSCRKSQPTICQGQAPAPGVLHGWRSLLIFFLFICLAFVPSYPIRAQDFNSILLEPPNTTHFPNITVDFKLPNNVASQDVNLTIEQLEVYENGGQVPVTQLTRQYRGVLFTLVINAGRDLDLRDATGTARYEKLSTSLQAWASSRTFAGEDGWSLVTNEDIEIRHARSAAEWKKGLQAYQPNFRALKPALSGLEAAIDLAGERVVSLGMDKVLLYITPPPTPDQIEPVRALAQKARAEQLQVNIWMVGDPLYLNNDQGGALMTLAEVTGGDFFHYTGEETIPNPEAYLSTLGSFYTLTYASGIRETGTYPLTVKATLNNETFNGQNQSFYIDIQPPNPIFVSPPTEYACQTPSDKAGAAAAMISECLEWQIILVFPDGHPREIVASRLVVDGVVVAINKNAPFDTFTWEVPLSIDPGEHIVQAEVEDSLGFSARTALTPLNISQIQTETVSGISVIKIAVILIAMLLGAAFLLLAVWHAKRLLKSQSLRGFLQHLFGKDKGLAPDESLNRPRKGIILATLLPLQETNNPIQIMLPEANSEHGKEPVQALLEGEPIEGMRVHLTIQDGGYWLRDYDSVGGTWINYERVGTKNVRITPGDLIHFGSVGFRFTIKQNQEPHKANVSAYKPNL